MSHHHQHLYSNEAGGPLPAIPRRTSMSRPAGPQPVKRVPKSAGVQRVTRSPSASSDSDNNSGPTSSPALGGAPLSLRARRARGPNPPTFPEALSTTPFPQSSEISGFGGLRASQTEDNITVSEKKGPSSRPLMYVPGMPLRVAVNLITQTSSNVAPPRAADDTRLIRKKSGQPIKSSLKSSRSAGSESFATLASQSSKSEPATPICKAVHFDSQLEHVKLFLAEQKPLAVSRDGSPTDDTSGTDSDFPSFIFGDADDQSKRRKLNIDIVNMPPWINSRADVALEELSISTDNSSILGHVRVRNIAFAKLVAVRFTFDSWQTTSEVTGRYTESLSPEFDRFAFTIKLADLLARIEEKTLVLAVRYSVAGQEFWDNNKTLNYVAKFSKSSKTRSPSSDEEPSTNSNLASLHTKLEKVVQGKERTGPAFSAQLTRSPVEPEPEAPTFKSTSLASRYDFDASLKNPWKYQETLPTHHRTNSFPQFARPSSLPNNTPQPAKLIPSKTSPGGRAPAKSFPPLGSPRDLIEGAIPTTPASNHDDETPFARPPATQQTRNHRRGYFDLSTFGATNVKHTPPTSPVLYDSLDLHLSDSLAIGLGQPKLASFSSVTSSEPPKSAPPTLSSMTGLGVRSLGAVPFALFPGSDTGFDSEISTPSLATPSSSRDTTPSPTEPFAELPSASSGSDSDGPQSPDVHYRDLINQYCFFTGSEESGAGSIMKGPTSDVPKEGLYDFAGSTRYNAKPGTLDLEMATTPRFAAHSGPISSPQRSSSADDIASLRSGSLTPTASRLNLLTSDSESRSSTPVPFAS